MRGFQSVFPAGFAFLRPRRLSGIKKAPAYAGAKWRVYPLMEPIMMPFTKYFCRKG